MTKPICIGIIGNYYGHASGAENIEEHPLPNGIFVIHQQDAETLTSERVAIYPSEGSDVDIEPEFVVRCKVIYERGRVVDLVPQAMTIGNDYTIRTLEGATKISDRKAWGSRSKGINHSWWKESSFIDENCAENINIVSYIERNGKIHCATPIASCANTKLFNVELIRWVVNKINNQQDEGIYEQILPEFEKSGMPDELLLYTGAPSYSAWGEDNFIQRGDRVHIMAYCSDVWQSEQIEMLATNNVRVNGSTVLTFSQEII